MLDIAIGLEGTKALVTLSGKIAVQTATQLKASIMDLPEDVRDIDIDVMEVTYVSSAGLRVFVVAAKLAKGRGGTMRLLHANQALVDTLAMTGLSAVLMTAE